MTNSHVQNSRFHHVGYVVASITEAISEYTAVLSLDWDGAIIHDPLQMVRVTFLPSNGTGQPTLELIEPAGRRSPVLKFAEAGGGLHHVCYEVNDLTAQIALAQAAGSELVRVPLAAAAFGGRKIGWVRTGTGQLVEFLQR